MAQPAATPCPIPQPPGSIDGTATGPYQPLPYPDRTLDQLAGVDRLDGEIIMELAGTNCVHGLTPDDLLARLMGAYPESGWEEDLLWARLLAGRREGRVCLAANGVYVLRNEMVRLNIKNQRFQGLVSSIVRIPVCQTTVSGGTSGAYSGDLPRCGQLVCGIPRILEALPPASRRILVDRFGRP